MSERTLMQTQVQKSFDNNNLVKNNRTSQRYFIQRNSTGNCGVLTAQKGERSRYYLFSFYDLDKLHKEMYDLIWYFLACYRKFCHTQHLLMLLKNQIKNTPNSVVIFLEIWIRNYFQRDFITHQFNGMKTSEGPFQLLQFMLKSMEMNPEIANQVQDLKELTVQARIVVFFITFTSILLLPYLIKHNCLKWL